jgi:hypothetical protein
MCIPVLVGIHESLPLPPVVGECDISLRSRLSLASAVCCSLASLSRWYAVGSKTPVLLAVAVVPL